MSSFTLTTARHVTLNYTAERWELYTDVAGAEKAAEDLNRAFTEAVNSGCTRAETQLRVENEMHRLRDFGASDTEPYYHLGVLLEKTFG